MWCVRWYLRYPISAAQMGEMTTERGLSISASCIWRWVQIYGPELDKRCRRHLKPTNRSWRLDETYIKVKGQERFLYRAVDSSGQTIDFLLTAKRDAAAAKRFFRRALAQTGNPMPRVINVDKNRSYPLAVEGLKQEGIIRQRCQLRQCKYLNNVVEQDHRNVKRRTWLAKGYGSVPTAWRTLRGIEAMDMIRKGRARRVAKGDTLAQIEFVEKLFGITA
jgi:transposase-like protein